MTPLFLFQEMVVRMDKKNVCVVFDLDDTLYLERDYVASGFRAVGKWCAEQFAIEGIEEQVRALFAEGRRGDIFNVALKELGVESDPGMLLEMVRVYREHSPHIKLLPDSLRCLARLKDRVYLGLLTDGNPLSQRAKIVSLRLQSYFDATVITGDWGTQFFKPHVRGYQYLESKLDMCRNRFVYVADNPSKDFFAPRTLGWNAIRVRRPSGLHEHQECSPGMVRVEVPSLEKIPELIFELYKPT
jgi:putative hydrolase of the HAD superfamily